jgi:hypothetical protein
VTVSASFPSEMQCSATRTHTRAAKYRQAVIRRPGPVDPVAMQQSALISTERVFGVTRSSALRFLGPADRQPMGSDRVGRLHGTRLALSANTTPDLGPSTAEPPDAELDDAEYESLFPPTSRSARAAVLQHQDHR